MILFSKRNKHWKSKEEFINMIDKDFSDLSNKSMNSIGGKISETITAFNDYKERSYYESLKKEMNKEQLMKKVEEFNDGFYPIENKFKLISNYIKTSVSLDSQRSVLIYKFDISEYEKINLWTTLSNIFGDLELINEKNINNIEVMIMKPKLDEEQEFDKWLKVWSTTYHKVSKEIMIAAINNKLSENDRHYLPRKSELEYAENLLNKTNTKLNSLTDKKDRMNKLDVCAELALKTIIYSDYEEYKKGYHWNIRIIVTSFDK